MHYPISVSMAVILASMPLSRTGSSARVIAETGVDYISIGDMTKNIKAVDLSMRLLQHY